MKDHPKISVEGAGDGYVQLVESMGSDLTVCNAARVSFNNETDWEKDEEALERLRATGSSFHDADLRKLSEKDQKLIKYLAKHGHWTPFAHPQISMRIKAPIPIRTQFFKHKQGFVENEISRRYVHFEPDFISPVWRGKPTNGAKQGSEDFIEIKPELQQTFDNMVEGCLRVYNDLIESGVAPEQARFILPQGMYTEWFWTGSLAAYVRFIRQRLDDHAQWEIRQYAHSISKIVRDLFPWSFSFMMLAPTE